MGLLWLKKLLLLVFCGFPLFVAFSQNLELYELKELGSCVKNVKKDSFDDLEISCPLDQFVSRARKINYSEPGKRYLVARLLIKALNLRHQNDLIKKRPATSRPTTTTSLNELFPDLPSSRSQYLQYFFPGSGVGNTKRVEDTQNKEALFLNQNKALVSEVHFWLDPLKLVTDDQGEFLKDEITHLLFWAYGLSLNFEALSVLVSENEKELFHHAEFERLYMNQLSQWIGHFGALPLRPWYGEKMLKKIGQEGGVLSDTAWTHWIEYLRFKERPIAEADRPTLAKHLRWLWIIGPGVKRHTEIRQLAADLGFSKEFESWAIENLDWKEYSWRVQSHIRALNTRAADQLMIKLLNDHPKLLTNRDEIWEALQLNIRILKILDERPRITKLIQDYEKRFDYFKIPSNKAELFKHYERIYQLAVQFWTLEENEEALRLMKMIEATKDKVAHSVQMKVAYVRARMEEKTNSKRLLETFKMDIREDQKLELGWRNFFKLLDGTEKEAQDATKFIEANTSLFRRLQESSLKISFWKAQALIKTKKNKEALELLNKNFKEDPYNFYGLFSAIQIKELSGAFPEDWVIQNTEEVPPFEVGKYLQNSGRPQKNANSLIAKAIVLAKARDFDRAMALAREAARARPWRSLASVDERQAGMRDIARLYVFLGDKRSAMNLMGGLISSSGGRLSAEDWEFIFPRMYESEIRNWSTPRGIDPWVISSVIRQESAFDPRARSPVDALGLMQLLPATAQREADILSKRGFKTEDLFQPTVAIELGVHHLHRLLENFDRSYVCSFAAYNAGIPPVIHWLNQHSGMPLSFIERIPYKETRDYVKKLLRNHIMYRRLYEKEMPTVATLLNMPTKTPNARLATPEEIRALAAVEDSALIPEIQAENQADK